MSKGVVVAATDCSISALKSTSTAAPCAARIIRGDFKFMSQLVASDLEDSPAADAIVEAKAALVAKIKARMARLTAGKEAAAVMRPLLTMTPEESLKRHSTGTYENGNVLP